MVYLYQNVKLMLYTCNFVMLMSTYFHRIKVRISILKNKLNFILRKEIFIESVQAENYLLIVFYLFYFKCYVQNASSLF